MGKKKEMKKFAACAMLFGLSLQAKTENRLRGDFGSAIASQPADDHSLTGDRGFSGGMGERQRGRPPMRDETGSDSHEGFRQPSGDFDRSSSREMGTGMRERMGERMDERTGERMGTGMRERMGERMGSGKDFDMGSGKGSHMQEKFAEHRGTGDFGSDDREFGPENGSGDEDMGPMDKKQQMIDFKKGTMSSGKSSGQEAGKPGKSGKSGKHGSKPSDEEFVQMRIKKSRSGKKPEDSQKGSKASKGKKASKASKASKGSKKVPNQSSN